MKFSINIDQYQENLIKLRKDLNQALEKGILIKNLRKNC